LKGCDTLFPADHSGQGQFQTGRLAAELEREFPIPWFLEADCRQSKDLVECRRADLADLYIPSILAFCNSPLMNSVEAYIHFERGLMTDDGRVSNESTETFLRQYMAEFAAFIAQVYTVLPRNQ
jgi:hypothetical protein